MASQIPLPTLLSQTLVAYTIEFDNEAEHQLPHSTSNHGSTPGALIKPWLVSMVMWFNCMRFVGENGVTVGELDRLARTKTNLNGMERWRYINVAPDPNDSRPKPPARDWIIRATTGGRKARQIWQPLFGVIENRWKERFGADTIKRLRESLVALIAQFDVDLPDCLPILGYGLSHRAPKLECVEDSTSDPESLNGLPLCSLLSKALLVFALEFERDSSLSLAVCANVLRVLNDDGVRVRDVPVLSGVSKEAISMAMGLLKNDGYAVEEPDPNAPRGKVIRLTPKGRQAQEAYHKLVDAIEDRWRDHYGEDNVRALREPLERLAGSPSNDTSPLFDGLEPYPDGWRAKVRKPSTLPHYPMVLHRGGFPDGS